MTTRNTASGYGWIAQWLHWLIAALIITQFVLAQLAEAAGDRELPVRQLGLLANHKSIGITVLLLAAIRLGWRSLSRSPDLPTEMRPWEQGLARVTHWLLYLLIFALPISGWLMSSASAYTVSWFNLLELPDLVRADEALKQRFLTTHHVLGTTLLVLAAVHVAAALKHHFLDRDAVLARMLSTSSLGAFVIVLAGSLWGATRSGTPPATPAAASTAPSADLGTLQHQSATPPSGTEAAPAVASGLPSWQIDYSASYIRFRAEQAGAGFDGSFGEWKADIRFAADALDASSARVEIAVASVSTGDAERDATLAAAEWFAADAYPLASFTAHEFTANDNGTFTASAKLTIKDLTAPVEFRFSVGDGGTAAHRTLDGSARLDRLALRLGTGDWADPTWVGRFVDVAVHVEARAQP